MSPYGGEESWWNFKETSEGVETGLELIVPESDSKSKQYFLWHNEMPYLEWATSRPRK